MLIGDSGRRSMGFCISASKFSSDASASRQARMMLPSSCSGAKIATEMNCIAISSPVLSTSRKINHSNANSTASFSRLSVVPCRNDRSRMRFTFCISSAKMRVVCACSRRISGKVSPRLLISSMLRSDSEMKPELRFVSRVIERCWLLISRLSRPVSPPSTSTPIRNTGTSSQCLVTAYQTRKPMPTKAANAVLMKALMKRSLSARTFCSIDSVSPLRRSSNSENFRRSTWRSPSLKICVPNFCTTSRVRYSCSALARRDAMATPTASASSRSTPETSSSSVLPSRWMAYWSMILPKMIGSTSASTWLMPASSRASSARRECGRR